MSKITKQEVQNIAKLARLKLTDSEVDEYTSQLEVILEYVTILDSIDLSNYKPTYLVSGKSSVYHKDELINYGAGQAELLSNARETDNNLIKVPRMVA